MRSMNEATVRAGVNDRPRQQTTTSVREQPSSGKKTIIKTTTTTTTTEEKRKVREQPADEEVAIVQDLGKLVDWSASSGPIERVHQERVEEQPIGVDGNKLVTTIGTIVAQSSKSRIVVALLKDGEKFQLKIQEMRPSVFEVGTSLREAQKYLDEHRRVMKNLDKQRQAPLESWMSKYKKISEEQERKSKHEMSTEMKLVFMCMAENLQGCWRALWWQLEQRLHLLNEACSFYQSCDRLLQALDKADNHVQVFRQEFLDGPSSMRFNQALNELKRLNSLVLGEYISAKQKQSQFVELIGKLGIGNMGDARQNYLISDAQNLVNFISNYLDPLEKRKIQLENVIKTTTNTKINQEEIVDNFGGPKNKNRIPVLNNQNVNTVNRSNRVIREISNFNDLNLVDNWLNVKIDQLNSSLLSSLGFGIQDTRSILNKHEQISLECSAIEDATLNFNGKNIHALKSSMQENQEEKNSLFEQQKTLALKSRDVVTILDARIVLLRRTIDFYSRAKEATLDINKWMRRLQVDNSLQSVQFVANELELKDVSAVVASGATILSELQQLQLSQQHGQRSKIVNLNLVTNGIRTVIDQLNQDLAHLKTVLNQRRLILLNEDTTKMASNFSNKCHQLQFWLDNHAKSYLISNNRIGFDTNSLKSYIQAHEDLRLAIQNKTPEVEALLRLLSTMTENLEAKSGVGEEIQRDTDNLRKDWIDVTNCLDRRIDLARKFLIIVGNASTVSHDLDILSSSVARDGRPRTPDVRTDADIRAQIEQSLFQLENQVRNFTQDAQKFDTRLEQMPGLEAKTSMNDINKEQIVAHSNGSLKLLNERYKSTATKLNVLGKGPLPAPSQRVGPWSPTFKAQPLAGSQQQQQQQRQLNKLTKTSPALNEVNKSLSTTTTTTSLVADEGNDSMRKGPRFVRSLVDQLVEPFSTIQLECETDPKTSAGSRIEWLLNNNKRIPANIKHSILNDGNKHKLVISQFNPTCCGTYTARVTNLETGQSASTSCQLRLAGIKEADNSDSDSLSSQQQQQQQQSAAAAAVNNRTRPKVVEPKRPLHQQMQPPSPAASSTSSFSQWTTTRQPQPQQQQSSTITAMERIIQGVESPASFDEQTPERVLMANISRQAGNVQPGQKSKQPFSSSTTTLNEATTTTTTTKSSIGTLPVTQSVYNGQQSLQPVAKSKLGNNLLRVTSNDYIVEPARSTPSETRSISRSPFDGTPKPPVFVQNMTDSLSGRCSRAGLVCVVVGNPPPTVEWLHNNQPIAQAKCVKPEAGNSANVCKLIIETMSDKTRGQYVCRATNRLGQTTTGLALNK